MLTAKLKLLGELVDVDRTGDLFHAFLTSSGVPPSGSAEGAGVDCWRSTPTSQMRAGWISAVAVQSYFLRLRFAAPG